MGARDLLARLDGLGLTVEADGDRLLIRPASKLTEDMRGELRKRKPEVLALLAGRHNLPTQATGSRARAFPGDSPLGALQPSHAQAETDLAARLAARRARLVRWGWGLDEARAMAERLARRDLAGDDRASCPECANYRPGRCGDHRRAGLFTPEVGRDLAALVQRCPGFKT